MIKSKVVIICDYCSNKNHKEFETKADAIRHTLLWPSKRYTKWVKDKGNHFCSGYCMERHNNEYEEEED